MHLLVMMTLALGPAGQWEVLGIDEGATVYARARAGEHTCLLTIDATGFYRLGCAPADRAVTLLAAPLEAITLKPLKPSARAKLVCQGTCVVRSHVGELEVPFEALPSPLLYELPPKPGDPMPSFLVTSSAGWEIAGGSNSGVHGELEAPLDTPTLRASARAQARRFLEEGRAALQAKRPADAKRLFELSAASDRFLVEPRLGRVSLALADNQPREAAEWIRRASAADAIATAGFVEAQLGHERVTKQPANADADPVGWAAFYAFLDGALARRAPAVSEPSLRDQLAAAARGCVMVPRPALPRPLRASLRVRHDGTMDGAAFVDATHPAATSPWARCLLVRWSSVQLGPDRVQPARIDGLDGANPDAALTITPLPRE